MNRRWSRAFLAVVLVAAGSAGRSEEAGTIRYQDAVLVQLAVTDLDRAVRFYTEVLEMELELRNDDLGWARVKPGLAGFTIGLGRQEKVEGSGTISINLGVAELDEVRSSLEARGVVFDGPTQEIPGVVRLAGFRDPDGNWIRLAGAPSPPQSP
jgi:predicted enzyme related to lactoylglutathione lyase